MPDLNLDSEAVRSEISEITQFWIDHGVDGFRLDAVTSYYTGDDQKNIEFLTALNDMVKAQKKDAYIVGEAWTNSATYHRYYASGIDSFFDFDYSGGEGIIASTVKGSSPASRFGKALMNTESALSEAAGSTGKSYVAIDAPFYTNHDMARSCGYYVGKTAQDRLKMAGALNLLMGGNAFIYYGEELGMKGSGKDENKRAPMYWSEDKAGEGMCKGPDGMDSFKMKYPSLEEQEGDPYSIYNYYKAAIRMRNTFPVIARGSTALVEKLSGDSICAFTRTSEDYEDVLVIFNTSEESQTVDISSDPDASQYSRLVYQLKTGDETASIDGAELTLPAYGVALLER
jgi:glycosidase